MKVLTYRQLKKKLRQHDKAFMFETNRGKGSHRMIMHPDIPGGYTLPVHGEGHEIHVKHLRKIRAVFVAERLFRLTVGGGGRHVAVTEPRYGIRRLTGLPSPLGSGHNDQFPHVRGHSPLQTHAA